MRSYVDCLKEKCAEIYAQWLVIGSHNHGRLLMIKGCGPTCRETRMNIDNGFLMMDPTATLQKSTRVQRDRPHPLGRVAWEFPNSSEHHLFFCAIVRKDERGSADMRQCGTSPS